MKGTIHKCVEKLVIDQFGIEKWWEILESVGLDEDHIFMTNDDVDENLTMDLLKNSCDKLNLSMEQLMDAFGEYWVHKYAPKVYPSYYEGVNSSKEFLLKLDKLHEEITQTVENARPPRFIYEEPDGKTLVMNYSSKRGLMALFVSLAKGLRSYYKDDMEIDTDHEAQKVTFRFAS